MILTTNTTYAARVLDTDSWLTIKAEDAVFPVELGEFIVAARLDEPTPAGRRNVTIHIQGGEATILGFYLTRQGAVAMALEHYDALTS